MKEKEIYQAIKEVLAKEPAVLAIFNNGSSVVGMNMKGSDEDFVVVLRNDVNKQKIINVLRKNFRIFKNEENPDIKVEEQYDLLGIRADFTIINKKEIENKVNSLYRTKENLLELQHFIKHKIIDSKEVYDPLGLLKKYQKKVEKYPKKVFEEAFDYSIYKIKENLYYWQHHEFRNEFQFGFEQWEILQPICEALYAKNRRLFMLPYKRLHKDLKKLKPDIEKEMHVLIRGKNTPDLIKKKIKIVKKIISKLEQNVKN